MSLVGITAYGAYLPKKRLNRAAIAAANSWANQALKGMGKGTRTMCNWDEDSITMAVEAGRDCLNGAGPEGFAGLYMASTTLPFADRLNSGLVAAALDLPDQIATLDISATLRAGTSALATALMQAGGADGNILVVAAEHPHTKPASPAEMNLGDGAAAVAVGTENVIAKCLGVNSLARDLVDHHRMEGEEFGYYLEERWIRDEGYMHIIPEVVTPLLEKAGVAAADITHFVMPGTLGRLGPTMAKALGISKDAVRDNLKAGVGDTGAAHALVMLVHTLEQAKPGEKILVIGFGQGADAILLETTGLLPKLSARQGVTGNLATGTEDSNYVRFLSFNGLIDIDFGMRAERDNRTAQSAFFRNRDAVTKFMGGKCTQCGTVQFPKTHVCVNPNCRAHETQEDFSFAGMGASVKTFTEDYLAYSASPPYHYGNIAFSEGGNVYMEFTDFEPGTVSVGQDVDMVFRIKDFDTRRGFRRYFWKAAPKRVAAS